mmetsp:Transcript_7608/g.13545  ORF Transcript_7608/g.13545 Transcript_7608/m.13545 type:complete len:402 (+) Transcript_7608:649-1854(+)
MVENAANAVKSEDKGVNKEPIKKDANVASTNATNPASISTPGSSGPTTAASSALAHVAQAALLQAKGKQAIAGDGKKDNSAGDQKNNKITSKAHAAQKSSTADEDDDMDDDEDVNDDDADDEDYQDEDDNDDEEDSKAAAKSQKNKSTPGGPNAKGRGAGNMASKTASTAAVKLGQTVKGDSQSALSALGNALRGGDKGTAMKKESGGPKSKSPSPSRQMFNTTGAVPSFGEVFHQLGNKVGEATDKMMPKSMAKLAPQERAIALIEQAGNFNAPSSASVSSDSDSKKRKMGEAPESSANPLKRQSVSQGGSSTGSPKPNETLWTEDRQLLLAKETCFQKPYLDKAVWQKISESLLKNEIFSGADAEQLTAKEVQKNISPTHYGVRENPGWWHSIWILPPY